MFDKFRDASASPSGICPGQVDSADRLHQEQALDEALMESFPASDPIAISFDCITYRREPHVQTP